MLCPSKRLHKGGAGIPAHLPGSPSDSACAQLRPPRPSAYFLRPSATQWAQPSCSWTFRPRSTCPEGRR